TTKSGAALWETRAVARAYASPSHGLASTLTVPAATRPMNSRRLRQLVIVGCSVFEFALVARGAVPAECVEFATVAVILERHLLSIDRLSERNRAIAAFRYRSSSMS